MIKKSSFQFLLAQLVMACLICVVACSSAPKTSPEQSRNQSYQAAIQDAKFPTANKISNQLTPIQKNKIRVLVANWNQRPEYKEHLGKTFQVSHEVWVTVAPELNEKCVGFEKSNLDIRLKQLLGLPISKTYNSIVEFWVSPKDIFRPCPDPEIDDSVCDLELSSKASKAHRDWFLRQMENSYSTNGYPWTRLGYTYDWGDSSKNHFGLSEYVVKPGAKIEVKAVESTEDYCSHKH